MHPEEPIAAGAQSGHGKADGDCKKDLDGDWRNRRQHGFWHSDASDLRETSQSARRAATSCLKKG
jgi:hypothetical protein